MTELATTAIVAASLIVVAAYSYYRGKKKGRSQAYWEIVQRYRRKDVH